MPYLSIFLKNIRKKLAFFMEASFKPSKKQSKKKKNLEKTFKPVDPSFCEFKKSEKKYRMYQDFLTDFSSLLDFSKNIDISSLPIEKKLIKGLTVYKFLDPEGVYLVKDFLTFEEQILITMKCLNEYNKKPYRNNLFIYDEKTEDKPIKLYSEVKKEEEKPSSEEKKEEKSPEKPFSEEKAIEESMPYNKERYYINDFSRYCFDKKIRWSNVGYQYDWNNRTYPLEKTNLPVDLETLSMKTKEFIKEEITDAFDYKAESTIINYYDAKNFMGGHLDDGEKDQKSPIFSYSFGLSCVFLMGGRTKDVKPWAIKLDSGDLSLLFFMLVLCLVFCLVFVFFNCFANNF